MVKYMVTILKAMEVMVAGKVEGPIARPQLPAYWTGLETVTPHTQPGLDSDFSEYDRFFTSDFSEQQFRIVSNSVFSEQLQIYLNTVTIK